MISLNRLTKTLLKMQAQEFADLVGVDRRNLNNWLHHDQKRRSVLALIVGADVMRDLDLPLYVATPDTVPSCREETNQVEKVIVKHGASVFLDRPTAVSTAENLEHLLSKWEVRVVIKRMTLSTLVFGKHDIVARPSLISDAVKKIKHKQLHMMSDRVKL